MKRKWTKKEKPKGFFELPERWEDEWQGMPEFVQDDRGPYKTIYVHFKNEKDVEDFAKLVEQKINPQTKFIWFPKAKHEDLLSYRCVDSDGTKEKRRKPRRR
jgi:hypothetical protein